MLVSFVLAPDIENFRRTFGITVGVTILQNTLKQRLPSQILSQFPDGAEISYALIPLIPSLAEPLRSEVRTAFADSIRNIWYTGIGLSGLGMAVAFFSKSLPLTLVMDEEWAMREVNEAREEKGDVEAAAAKESMDAKPEAQRGSTVAAQLDAVSEIAGNDHDQGVEIVELPKDPSSSAH